MILDKIVFTLEDVRSVRHVSVNIKDFEPYAREVQQVYLEPLIGPKLYLLLTKKPGEDRFITFLNGHEYKDRCDFTRNFRGVKYFLCYMWLYRFMAENNVNHTPIGPNVFEDAHASPAPDNSLKIARANYISIARGQEAEIKEYLYSHSSKFPEYASVNKEEYVEDTIATYKVVGNRHENPIL